MTTSLSGSTIDRSSHAMGAIPFIEIVPFGARLTRSESVPPCQPRRAIHSPTAHRSLSTPLPLNFSLSASQNRFFLSSQPFSISAFQLLLPCSPSSKPSSPSPACPRNPTRSGSRTTPRQELARGFGLRDYTALLASDKANEVRLMTATEFGRKLLRAGEDAFSESLLRHALFAIREVAKSPPEPSPAAPGSRPRWKTTGPTAKPSSPSSNTSPASNTAFPAGTKTPKPPAC